MSLKERKAEAKQRVEQIMQACKAAGRVTLEKVIQNTRQPEPYKHPSKMTVTEVAYLHGMHQRASYRYACVDAEDGTSIFSMCV